MAHTAVGPITASPPRRRSHITKFAVMAVMALVGTALLPPGVSMAATAPGLGTAESFAVLGSSTVTNTGPTVVNGDLGVSPGLAVTGFDDPGGPGIVNGTIHAGDATALAARSAATTAYNALSDQDCDVVLADQELGGLTLVPGVYCLSTTAQLTGALTLDAVGDPAAVFIFRVGTALTTASDSSVTFLNDFATCNVFWQAGSAATLGTDTDFVGTLITLTEAITANTGATVIGRLLSINAAVTLDTNVITTPTCTSPPDTTTTTVATTTTVDGTTPADGTDDSTDGGTDDSTDGTDSTGGVPTDGGPSVPSLTGGPSVPSLTGGPSVPSLTGGPAVPASPRRPPLPFTGSNLMPAAFAVLAVMVGGALILMTNTNRVATTRSSDS